MVKNKTTTPSDYRKTAYSEKTVEVPSGAKFKIRVISPVEALQKGLDDLPNPFLEFLQEEDKKEKEKKMEALGADKKSREYLEKFLEIAITEGILEPKVFIKYDKEKADKGLFWAEITSEDQTFLLNKITGADLKNY